MIRVMRPVPAPFLAALAALCLTATVVPAQDHKHNLTPEGLWSLARVGAPVLSPDGGQLLYTVSRTDVVENRGQTTVYLLDLRDGGPAR